MVQLFVIKDLDSGEYYRIHTQRSKGDFGPFHANETLADHKANAERILAALSTSGRNLVVLPLVTSMAR